MTSMASTVEQPIRDRLGRFSYPPTPRSAEMADAIRGFLLSRGVTLENVPQLLSRGNAYAHMRWEDGRWTLVDLAMIGLSLGADPWQFLIDSMPPSTQTIALGGS